jgi:hypothetical protein
MNAGALITHLYTFAWRTPSALPLSRVIIQGCEERDGKKRPEGARRMHYSRADAAGGVLRLPLSRDRRNYVRTAANKSGEKSN